MVKSAASTTPYPPNGFASPPSGSAPPVQPSWHGFIHTTHDALIVLEACLQGKLNHISRRPHDRERSNLIVSGNVFVYEENASGIKRWTDGTTWSPSRIMGNFLVYRELKDPWPAGQKKVAQKRKRSSTDQNMDSSPAASQTNGSFISKNPEEDRRLVGSLVDSYGFKPDGLVKRTLTIALNGVSHHIICYYKVSEVKNGNLHRPGFDATLHNITPRSELVNSNQLKFPINDPDEVDPMMDQYSTGTLPSAPTQQSLFPPNYTLHDATSFQAQQPTNLSVQSIAGHNELSAASNLPQLVQATAQISITSYSHIPVSSGAVSGIATGYNPVDSLMIPPPELQIPFKPQYPLHDSGFPTPEHSTHSPDDYHSPEEQSSKRPRVDSTPVATIPIGPAQTPASLDYGNHVDHTTDFLFFPYMDLAASSAFPGANAWYSGSVVENTMYTVPTPQFSNVGSY